MHQDELKRFVRDWGVDFFGVADLTPAHQFLLTHSGEHIAAFPCAIALGIRLPDAIVDELHRHEDLSAILPYRGLYNSVNSSLDHVALRVTQQLQAEGFKGYPIPASSPYDPNTLKGTFSHKLAAHLAGLGWIGKSCMLITPNYGPRVRWVTVLTDVLFKTGRPIVSQCGKCRECVDICPVDAFTGIPFDASEPREARFDAGRCRDYFNQRQKQLGEMICGLCVYACPVGKHRE